jgi:hypothetical protein
VKPLYSHLNGGARQAIQLEWRDGIDLVGLRCYQRRGHTIESHLYAANRSGQGAAGGQFGARLILRSDATPDDPHNLAGSHRGRQTARCGNQRTILRDLVDKDRRHLGRVDFSYQRRIIPSRRAGRIQVPQASGVVHRGRIRRHGPEGISYCGRENGAPVGLNSARKPIWGL